jgi:hypothetical protein
MLCLKIDTKSSRAGGGSPIIARMSDEHTAIPDVTPAYRLWSELFAHGLRMALSTTTDDPREKREAWERLIRGHARALAERDAVEERLARIGKGPRHEQ